MINKRGFSKVITVALLAVLVVATAFLWLVVSYFRGITRGEVAKFHQFQNKFTMSATAAKNAVQKSAAVATADDPYLGPPVAKLTVVEFADFECPFSREEAWVLRDIAARFSDRVKFIYRDFPLDELHPHAREAAEAAEFGHEQGKFWPMHDKLFGNAERLGLPDLKRYGREIGLDENKFVSCLEKGEYRAEVEEDYRSGLAAGVRGTPTFFFNGQKIEGAIPARIFEQIIQSFLQ